MFTKYSTINNYTKTPFDYLKYIKSVKCLAELEKHQYIKSYSIQDKLEEKHMIKNDNDNDNILLESDTLIEKFMIFVLDDLY